MRGLIIVALVLGFLGPSCSSHLGPTGDGSLPGDQGPGSGATAPELLVTFPDPIVDSSSGRPAVRMEGLPTRVKAGAPMLPFRPVRLLLPLGHRLVRAEVSPAGWTMLPGTYELPPASAQQPLSLMNASVPPAKDPAVYQSDMPWPREPFEVVGTQTFRGYTYAIVNLFPVGYFPRSGQLFSYRSMSVRLVTAPLLGSAVRPAAVIPQTLRTRPGDAAALKRMLDETRALASYKPALALLAAKGQVLRTGSLLDPQVTYLIITHEQYREAFERLAVHKRQRGVTTQVVTVDQIVATTDGKRPDGKTDDQTRIRNFITQAYREHGTEFVLLAGDSDRVNRGGESQAPIVPHRGLFCAVGDTVDREIPADLYYGCLDGTFDENANGVYGEPNDGPGGGDVDLAAEVMVGRAPVDSVQAANAFVDKVIRYETTAPDSLKNVLLVGELLWEIEGQPGIYATPCMEEIRFGTDAGGFHTEGFACEPSIQVETLYDRKGFEFGLDDIFPRLNSGRFHVINHLGHSDVGSNMRLSNQLVDNLKNPNPYILYSQGCYCGAFDNKSGSGFATSADSIAEHHLELQAGAVAVLMNSRYGWGSLDDTLGSSQLVNREFWNAILADTIRPLGQANSVSKERNVPRMNDENALRWSIYSMNLLGDPEMPFALNLGERPVADAGEPQSVVEGEVAVLDGSASADPNGAPLAYRWTQVSGIPVTLEGADSARPRFTAPEVVAPEVLRFSLRVSNGSRESLADTVTVTVLDRHGNLRPVARAGDDATVTELEQVILDGSGSFDPDPGQVLTYRWRQIEGPQVTLDDPAAARPRFTAPAVRRPTPLVFELVVSDGTAESHADSVTILVDLAYDIVLDSTDTPMALPDNGGTGVLSTIMATRFGSIQSVRVDVDITHPSIGDLFVRVICPGPDKADLHDMEGGGTDDLRASYFLENEFRGKRADGIWRLLVADRIQGNAGTLNRWSVRIKLQCTPDCTGKECGDDGCGGSCGSCEKPESCTTGTCTPSGTCAYRPAPASTVCRPATGTCDIAETCDGSSMQCPADTHVADGTACTGGTCYGGLCSSGKTCRTISYSASRTHWAEYHKSPRKLIYLTAGQMGSYSFDLCYRDTMGNTYLRLYKDGVQVAEDDDGCGQSFGYSWLRYTVPESGWYELVMGCWGENSCRGTVRLHESLPCMDP